MQNLVNVKLEISEQKPVIPGHRLDLSELRPEARRRFLGAMALNCFLLLATLLSLAGLIIKGHVVVEERGAVVAKPQQWAVLVAGSKGWDNYRHQADAHHAYALLVEQGIPLDNIIFFACDDIAYHEENPFPGEIFNEPSGDNVYDPDSIDYSGD